MIAHENSDGKARASRRRRAMALTIRLYPDPALRRRAEPITEITDEIRTLADRMVETLVKRVGYGLAAPQVGVAKRLIIVDVEDELYVLANPEIIEAGDERVVGVEGCLSFPGVEAEVERARRVRVRGLTMEGEEITIDAEDLLARVFQHEVDHLEGVLFIDYLGRAKRVQLLKEYERNRRSPAETDGKAKAKKKVPERVAL
jgi:peptide deformylase